MWEIIDEENLQIQKWNLTEDYFAQQEQLAPFAPQLTYGTSNQFVADPKDKQQRKDEMIMHQFGGAMTNDSVSEIRSDSKMIQADMDTQKIMAEIN